MCAHPRSDANILDFKTKVFACAAVLPAAEPLQQVQLLFNCVHVYWSIRQALTEQSEHHHVFVPALATHTNHVEVVKGRPLQGKAHFAGCN